MMPILDTTTSQDDAHTNMIINGPGNWLSNNPVNPTPPSSTTSSTSPTAASIPRPDHDNDHNTTVPGGTTASLPFYKASLARRLKQLNEGHHAALVHTSLQDPTPLIHHGPSLTPETNTFAQTHADFHSAVRAKHLGPYVFCAVCGLRLKREGGAAEDEMVEMLPADEGRKRLEDDDKLVRC